MPNTHSAVDFERLCAPYSAMVYRHCLMMLKNTHDAEDAAQESMLRAFRAFAGFRGDAVASWLFRIAHNTCLDMLKSAHVKHGGMGLERYEEVRGELRDLSPTPEEHYEKASGDERLRAAVAALPKEQQLLLSLFYGQSMRYQDIASATGMREGTVKSRLSRARAALAQALGTPLGETENE